jgi:NodT family efflux transporter outer membrane factor (OMF) lipoprotein
MRRRFACCLMAATMLAGCAVGPDYQAPQASSPTTWFSFTARPPKPEKPAASGPSVAVTALERRVPAANLDLRVAATRLAESRQQREIIAADQMPVIDGNANYTRERPSSKGIFSALGTGVASSASNPASTANGKGGVAGGLPGASLLSPFNLYSVGFDASWELDLWGRVRREVESANASVEASEQARRAALVSVLAELARDYVQLRGIQATADITRQNLATAQDSLRLTQDRFNGGLTTQLDVENARSQVATTQAQLPSLEQQEDAGINAISLLLGEQPGALRPELVSAKPVPPVPPLVPVGLPSDLLRRRPDIVQAEDQLHAATADIGVAVADFYPKISLSGSLSLQALQFKDVGNWAARQYALGPTLTLPLFEGGRLRGTLELRRAQQQEAYTTYQKTVLQAWHDVANAMDAYEAEQRRQAQLKIAVTSAANAVNLSKQRYSQGIADFLQVLDAERSLLSAQQQLADSTTNVSTNLVAIYKALGGGWETEQTVAEAK